eukprot:gene6688-7226_t
MERSRAPPAGSTCGRNGTCDVYVKELSVAPAPQAAAWRTVAARAQPGVIVVRAKAAAAQVLFVCEKGCMPETTPS